MSGDVMIATAQHGRDWMDWANLISTICGVIIVGFYTFVTYRHSEPPGLHLKRRERVATRRLRKPAGAIKTPRRATRLPGTPLKLGSGRGYSSSGSQRAPRRLTGILLTIRLRSHRLFHSISRF